MDFLSCHNLYHDSVSQQGVTVVSQCHSCATHRVKIVSQQYVNVLARIFDLLVFYPLKFQKSMLYFSDDNAPSFAAAFLVEIFLSQSLQFFFLQSFCIMKKRTNVALFLIFNFCALVLFSVCAVVLFSV